MFLKISALTLKNSCVCPCCRHWATVSIATPPQWSMRWDIASLVQSVNLIRAMKSITSTSLNIFFCVNRGTTGNIFETFFGLSEQDWMDETSYNFAFQMSVSAFVF